MHEEVGQLQMDAATGSADWPLGRPASVVFRTDWILGTLVAETGRFVMQRRTVFVYSVSLHSPISCSTAPAILATLATRQ